MAVPIFYLPRSPSIIINTDATLADATRKAVAYNNSVGDRFADFFLDVEYETSLPTAGAIIGELFLLPGDGAGTEEFAEGGDGTIGSNVDPQKIHQVGFFETRNPSLTVNEILVIPAVQLYPANGRVVIKNVAGRAYGATWELRIRPYTEQI